LADAWDLEELLLRAENPAKTLCCSRAVSKCCF
jgi:hypothetical protein